MPGILPTAREKKVLKASSVSVRSMLKETVYHRSPQLHRQGLIRQNRRQAGVSKPDKGQRAQAVRCGADLED